MNQINPIAGMAQNMLSNAARNNPVFGLINAVRSGGNPMALLQNMAKSNPQVNQMMNMVQGKTPQELLSFTRNVAKEKGTTIEQVAQQLGIQIPQGK